MLGDASIAGRRYVERQWSGTKKKTRTCLKTKPNRNRFKNGGDVNLWYMLRVTTYQL